MAHEGIPGLWHWQLAWGAGGRFRLTLQTAAEAQTLDSDGAVVRTWLGSALVSEQPLAGSGVAALLRFVALSALDPLAEPERVAWQELPSATRESGEARALQAHFLSAPNNRFTLVFDVSQRLVRVAGAVSIPAFGDGVLEARYRDYRRVGSFWLPFAIEYRFRGAPLLDERVESWQPGEWD